MAKKSLKRIRVWLILFGLIQTVILVLVFSSDLLFFLFEPAVTVAIPQGAEDANPSSPFGPGLDRELLALLQHRSGYRFKVIPNLPWDSAWAQLSEGAVDILISPGLANEQMVNRPLIANGPPYGPSRPVLLRNRYRLELAPPETMCREDVIAANNPSLAVLLNTRRMNIPCLVSVPPVSPKPLALLLKELSEDRFRFILADDRAWKAQAAWFPEVLASPLAEPVLTRRWFWNSRRPKLAQTLSQFWGAMPTDPEFHNLEERYVGFLPPSADPESSRRLFETIQNELPQYSAAIRKAAQEHRLDPLLLIAVIYQESRFDPDARSVTGVRGLLQITTTTAEELNMSDRRDPVQNIQGGAKYLRSLWDRFPEADASAWDRWFLVLSAYNQGPKSTKAAMALARARGRDSRLWREVKMVFPGLAAQRPQENELRGSPRGEEAVAFVDGVRYYYAVLHGIIALARPEAKHLTPFLDAVPASWP